MSNETKSNAHPLAYILVASGGAVVGTDYAKWLEVDPIVGAIIGGIISMVILKAAYHLYSDPGGEIKASLTKVGGVIGAITGAYIVLQNSQEGFGWVVGAIIGGGIGAKTKVSKTKVSGLES